MTCSTDGLYAVVLNNILTTHGILTVILLPEFPSHLITPSAILTPPLTVPSFLVNHTIGKSVNPYHRFWIVSFSRSIVSWKSLR